MRPDTIFQRTDKVQFARLDDEMLAIDAQAGYCYGLNETAIQVWELLANPTSLSDLCEQLRAIYQIDAATCTEEVGKLLEMLKADGLVRVCDEASV